MPADRASLPPESSSKIPRPPNAWILFRSDMSRRVDPNIVDSTGRPTRKTQAAVSKEISEMWKNLDAQTRAEYERRADAKKAEHSIQYPNYRFAPVKKEDRQKLKEEKKQLKEQEKANRRRARPAPYTPAATAASTPISGTPIPNYPQPMAPLIPDHFLVGQLPSPPFSAHESPESSTSSTELLHPNATLDLDVATQIDSAPSSRNDMLRLPSVMDPSDPGPSHWHDQPQASTSAWAGDSSQQQPSGDPGLVQFDIPQQQSWGSDSAMPALCSTTGDPSVFQLAFDNQFLSGAPLELSMLDPSLLPDMRQWDFSSLLEGVPNNDLFAPDLHNASFVQDLNNASMLDPQLFAPELQPQPYNGDEFIDFEQAQSTSSRSTSSATQFTTPLSTFAPVPTPVLAPAPATDQIRASTPASEPMPTSYTPPSGPAYTGQRRVAGSWPRTFAMESASSPQPAQV